MNQNQDCPWTGLQIMKNLREPYAMFFLEDCTYSMYIPKYENKNGKVHTVFMYRSEMLIIL